MGDWRGMNAASLDKALIKVFQQLDDSSNGTINQDKFVSLFEGNLDRGEVDLAFNRIDANHDGQASIEEMKSFLFDPVTEDELQVYGHSKQSVMQKAKTKQRVAQITEASWDRSQNFHEGGKPDAGCCGNLIDLIQQRLQR